MIKYKPWQTEINVTVYGDMIGYAHRCKKGKFECTNSKKNIRNSMQRTKNLPTQTSQYPGDPEESSVVVLLVTPAVVFLITILVISHE